MPKQYVKLRIGLADHLPMFADCPDAFLVYGHCLLSAPISGPDGGVVPINHGALADAWGWSRPRMSRALRWLQEHPSREHPLLVRVAKGVKSRPSRYVIPRFETTENKRRFGNGAELKTSEFGSHNVTELNRIAGLGSHNVTELNRIRNIRNARVRKNENKKNDKGANAVYEKAEWITVRDEAEARRALLDHRGYRMLPEHIRDDAVENAMRNLEFYRIRYLEDDEPKELSG